MFSMIMGSFDGFRSMLFGFGSMPAPPPEEAGIQGLDGSDGQQNKPYGYDVEPPTRGTRLVERMDGDGDGDGSLSWAELGENQRGRRIARNFDKIDSDGSGTLSAGELDSFRQSRGTRLVERMDGDGDGGLSWNELGETRRGRQIARSFDRIDNDGDGKLTAAELDSFQRSRQAAWLRSDAMPGLQEDLAEDAALPEMPPAPDMAESTETAAAPAAAPADPVQQGFFFALSPGGTANAQQASSSYNFVVALFQ